MPNYVNKGLWELTKHLNLLLDWMILNSATCQNKQSRNCQILL